MSKHVALIPALALALALVPLSALAQNEEQNSENPNVNVRLSFRMGKLEGEKKVVTKSYDLIVSAGNSSKLLSGARVPFPAGNAADDGASEIVYQNIGFSTHVSVMLIDENHLRLIADIEDSRIRDEATAEHPTVETRQLAVSAILENGETLELTRAEGLSDQSGFVEVKAEILR